ncbi:MAG: PHB depolymerase family esterase [Thermodesulfobacteriota bacterium]
MTEGKKKNMIWSVGIAFLFCCFLLPFTPQGSYSQNIRGGPGIQTFNLSVKGIERSYLIYVPASYNRQKPMPLVIMLHGGGGTGQAAMWETGWAEKAEKEGFIAAFPNAKAANPEKPSHFSRNPQLWNDGSDRFYPGQAAPDDVGFLAAMLDDLYARYPYDKGRVFITGFSNGASMSFLAAAKMPDRIAAIAPVAGALWFDPPILKPPVPLCYITGTADPLNIIEGGVPRLASGGSDRVRAKAKPPVKDSILKWAKALECPEAPKISEENGVRTETYSPGQEGSEVVYIAVEGLGHIWPGGRSLLPESMVGKTSKKIKANEVIWDFFKKHKRSP